MPFFKLSQNKNPAFDSDGNPLPIRLVSPSNSMRRHTTPEDIETPRPVRLIPPLPFQYNQPPPSASVPVSRRPSLDSAAAQQQGGGPQSPGDVAGPSTVGPAAIGPAAVGPTAPVEAASGGATEPCNAVCTNCGQPGTLPRPIDTPHPDDTGSSIANIDKEKYDVLPVTTTEERPNHPGLARVPESEREQCYGRRNWWAGYVNGLLYAVVVGGVIVAIYMAVRWGVGRQGEHERLDRIEAEREAAEVLENEAGVFEHSGLVPRMVVAANGEESKCGFEGGVGCEGVGYADICCPANSVYEASDPAFSPDAPRVFCCPADMSREACRALAVSVSSVSPSSGGTSPASPGHDQHHNDVDDDNLTTTTITCPEGMFHCKESGSPAEVQVQSCCPNNSTCKDKRYVRVVSAQSPGLEQGPPIPAGAKRVGEGEERVLTVRRFGMEVVTVGYEDATTLETVVVTTSGGDVVATPVDGYEADSPDPVTATATPTVEDGGDGGEYSREEDEDGDLVNMPPNTPSMGIPTMGVPEGERDHLYDDEVAEGIGEKDEEGDGLGMRVGGVWYLLAGVGVGLWLW